MRTLRAGRCSKAEYRRQSHSVTRLRRESLILNPRREAGFTLLELIVVIFVLSLFIGLVMPSFYGIGAGRLRSDAGRMASALRYLNDSAISGKETIPLNISLDDKTIRWKSREGEKSEVFNYLFEIVITSAGKISEGEVTVFFEPNGLQENMDIAMK
ncbi:MAG: prepilin-type N-terminal cleavage/methylation domain-containing protein, partial [Nitrospirae bacterium]|nr:prepilin-type N-terminal cleavage/methylation domain-containing protein [Nitrospirota bacterium]